MISRDKQKNEHQYNHSDMYQFCMYGELINISIYKKVNIMFFINVREKNTLKKKFEL